MSKTNDLIKAVCALLKAIEEKNTDAMKVISKNAAKKRLPLEEAFNAIDDLLNTIKNPRLENIEKLEKVRHSLETLKNKSLDLEIILNTNYGSHKAFSNEEVTPTPLNLAVLENNPEMVSLLLENGSDPIFQHDLEGGAFDVVFKSVLGIEPISDYSDATLKAKIAIIDLLYLRRGVLSEDILEKLTSLAEETLTQIEDFEEIEDHTLPKSDSMLTLKTELKKKFSFQLSLLKKIIFKESYQVLIEAISDNNVSKTRELLKQERFPFYIKNHISNKEHLYSIRLSDIKDPNHPYHIPTVLVACSIARGAEILVHLHEKEGFGLGVCDPNGSTLLHYAASAGNAEVVLYLLENGADPLRHNKAEKTAVDFCRDESIRKIIINYRPSGLVQNPKNPAYFEVPKHLNPSKAIIFSEKKSESENVTYHQVPDIDDVPPAKRPRIS